MLCVLACSLPTTHHSEHGPPRDAVRRADQGDRLAAIVRLADSPVADLVAQLAHPASDVVAAGRERALQAARRGVAAVVWQRSMEHARQVRPRGLVATGEQDCACHAARCYSRAP